MTWHRIVETDNHGGDYPNEIFLSLPLLRKGDADAIATVINDRLCSSDQARRFWKVVENGYQVKP